MSARTSSSRRMRARNAAPPPRVSVPPETSRRLQSLATALRAGATSLALLGGIACYLLLIYLNINAIWAAVIGLVFAVLGRIATVSLGREWLLHSAHQRLLREQAASGASASAARPPARSGEVTEQRGTRRKGR